MSNVCATCERDLPSLESLVIGIGEEELATCVVTGFTLHVRCECGQDSSLRQAAKGFECESGDGPDLELS